MTELPLPDTVASICSILMNPVNQRISFHTSSHTSNIETSNNIVSGFKNEKQGWKSTFRKAHSKFCYLNGLISLYGLTLCAMRAFGNGQLFGG